MGGGGGSRPTAPTPNLGDQDLVSPHHSCKATRSVTLDRGPYRMLSAGASRTRFFFRGCYSSPSSSLNRAWDSLCRINLGTRWRWVVSFTPRPLYSRTKSLRYPLGRGLGEPQIRSGDCGGKRSLLNLPGIKPQLLGCPVTTPTQPP
jgi:hypothetical protein